MRNIALSAAVLLGLAAGALAGGAPASAKSSPEFERMKSLAGTWKGESSSHGQKGPAEATYKLTSGGSVVLETLDPGTPHEMVTLYHDAGGKLVMTHYCAMGNQPRMAVRKSTPEALEFGYVHTEGIDTRRDAHMHSLKLIMKDKDSLEQRWTDFKNGKPNGEAVFNLKRS